MLSRPHPHLPQRPAATVERELDAYNAAFHELELDWHWDTGVLHELAGIVDEKDRICAYLRGHRAHLLSVYEAEALAEHIVEAKTRVLSRSAARDN